MSNGYELLNHFEAVRLRAYNFCSFRNWEKFHLPTSLALALSGECGEVSEIFQWKGTLEEDMKQLQTILTEQEIIHIGEEIADVCIYTTRLCDVCNINLGKIVLETIQSIQPDFQLPSSSSSSLSSTSSSSLSFAATRPWPTDINFDQISNILTPKTLQYRSHRMISLELQSTVGELCAVFQKYSEAQTVPGLPHWKGEDITIVANKAATIYILMICLAKLCHLSIGKCITDKFSKNDAKYPIALSKGSSAKYTAYIQKVGNQKQYLITVAWIGFALFCFLGGRYTQLKIDGLNEIIKI